MWLKLLLEIALFIVGMAILTVFIVAIMFVVGKVKLKYRKMNSSMTNVHVKMVSKHMDTCYVRKKRKISYHVIYETDDGETLELLVDKWTYPFIKKGDIGILTFQDMKFIDFERD